MLRSNSKSLSSEIYSSPLKGCGDNCGSDEKQCQPTAGFMTHVTCRLTAKNRDQLRDLTLGNRVWAIFTFLHTLYKSIQPCIPLGSLNQVPALLAGTSGLPGGR